MVPICPTCSATSRTPWPTPRAMRSKRTTQIIKRAPDLRGSTDFRVAALFRYGGIYPRFATHRKPEERRKSATSG